jgi:hypothetical protein
MRMRALVRILLLWTLIVSLPLRAIAAESALPCQMAHAEAVRHAAVQHIDGCDDHGTMMVAQSAPHARADAAAARVDGPCHQASALPQSSCHACCASHVGAAAPPAFAVLALPATRVNENTIPAISSFTGWIPSRIERPPRA